jgi:malto-oligosyltrehalose trehalohydrolase
MSTRHAVELPFGASLLAPGETRFRLWAPAAGTVEVEFDSDPALPLRGAGDGFFEGHAGCGAGARYRYRIDGALSVPDPASRAQAEDVHGWSLVVDPLAYPWQHHRWQGRPWHESIVYEAHAGCFGGGFAGLLERLPHLAALGVTALELMPIADFPGRRNWGYDGVLPYAPDTAYGSPGQLKRLIDAAHELGLCVYLDVVYNHFGPDGNYLHRYAPQFFDSARHSPWGAAIDFERPQVREFFIHNALYWLMEYRFDGLRLDAVHAIADSGFLDELAQRVRGTVEPGRHVHLILENERNDAQRLEQGYDAQWNDDLHNVVHVLLTGENEGYYANYREQPARLLARGLAEGFIYQGQGSPSHGGEPRGTHSGHLSPSSFVFFLQNHDQVGNRAFGERLVGLASPKALRAAATLQLLCPQVPLLFMGEEWGAAEPFLFFTDFHDALADAVREGRRREFAAFAAFAGAEQRAAIPDPNAVETCAASIPALNPEQPAQLEWLQFYRRLLQIRRETLLPALAAARSLGAAAHGAAAVTARWRLDDGSRLWIGLNLGREDVPVPPPAGGLLFESLPACCGAAAAGLLQAESCCAFLELAA